MGTSQNPKFRRHTALHLKNLAYIYSHMRRCDFWFRHHIASDMSLRRNELFPSVLSGL